MNHETIPASDVKELDRVMGTLSDSVMSFCAGHVGGTVSANELHAYVSIRHGKVAPDSPGRIMRKLRDQGRVRYTLMDRAKSQYRIIEVM